MLNELELVLSKHEKRRGDVFLVTPEALGCIGVGEFRCFSSSSVGLTGDVGFAPERYSSKTTTSGRRTPDPSSSPRYAIASTVAKARVHVQGSALLNGKPPASTSAIPKTQDPAHSHHYQQQPYSR